MYLTLQLILAHFIADYPVQPGDLVVYKYNKFFGIVAHCIVHMSVTMLILMPYLGLPAVYLGAFIAFASHMAIDTAKIKLEKRFPKVNTFITYVTDQALHVLALTLISLYIGKVEPVSIFGNIELLSFLLILTLSTYFYDVTRWTFRNSKKRVPYKRDYRMMARNALIVVIAYGAYLMFK